MRRLKTPSKLWQDLKAAIVRQKLATALLIFTLVVMIFIFWEASRREAEKEKQRRENFSYVVQVESLGKVRDSLNNLIEFVNVEREKLRESEDLVNGLKAEEEKLKPVVETNRQAIEAILNLQYEKSRSDVWKERGIGFASGVLASVIASFMYGLLRRVSDRKKSGDLSRD